MSNSEPAKNSLRHATMVDVLLWLLRRYRRYRVTGKSMMPLLRPLQEVLFNPSAYQQQLPLPNEIVIASHPYQSDLRIIKRILFVETDGRCYLQGDNADESQDSRQLGLVPLNQIQGKVLCLFP